MTLVARDLGFNKDVAVKRILSKSHGGDREFIADVTAISQLRHRNLVELMGWCHEDDELLLVYEFLNRGSLDNYLFGAGRATAEFPVLNWERRYNILCGVASALDYLHHGSRNRVLHRDIKASNVMLDHQYTPRLGDFGLARVIERDGKSHHSTVALAGTRGYMAPECYFTGRASVETDVYPFGVFAMEAAAREATVDVEVGLPRKKARVLSSEVSGVTTVQLAGAVVVPTGHAGGSPGRGEAGTSREAVGEALRGPSIRELCRLSTGGEDEPYQMWVMGDLPRGEASDPLVARLEGLSRGSRVWAEGDFAAEFVRGGLHPDIARDLYTLPSEVLLGKSAKSLLWGNHYAVALMDRVCDAGRIIAVLSGRNAELRKQVDEVRAGGAPEAFTAAEQRAADSDAEAARLRSELQASEERNMELQTHLKASVAEARSARGDSLELIRRLEEVRAEARGASEALDVEIRQRLEKDKRLIEDYKGSSGFQLGLVRTRRVSYEYGYRIALAHFKGRHPDLEVAEDPFDSLLEDMSVDMPDEVPFDDSPDDPEE
ncbi:unnamed protein product [Musa acuminata subsp. malaccensis]|uniref:non-specific serine/threonine protein kinase n=1 Tax=Musa acuminata subsp. malaccensis TaxID=214687 RepID=A0A804J3B8_MUSAM|nr:unnamed protein product [Musa acuminata subsp. malaccensis]